MYNEGNDPASLNSFSSSFHFSIMAWISSSAAAFGEPSENRCCFDRKQRTAALSAIRCTVRRDRAPQVGLCSPTSRRVRHCPLLSQKGSSDLRRLSDFCRMTSFAQMHIRIADSVQTCCCGQPGSMYACSIRSFDVDQKLMASVRAISEIFPTVAWRWTQHAHVVRFFIYRFGMERMAHSVRTA